MLNVARLLWLLNLCQDGNKCEPATAQLVMRNSILHFQFPVELVNRQYWNIKSQVSSEFITTFNQIAQPVSSNCQIMVRFI